MDYDNRLVVDEDQEPRLIKKGEKITSSGMTSFGFGTRETDEDVVEIRVQLDIGTESVYITRKLWEKISAAFYEPPTLTAIDPVSEQPIDSLDSTASEGEEP